MPVSALMEFAIVIQDSRDVIARPKFAPTDALVTEFVPMTTSPAHVMLGGLVMTAL
jgi:hypothetical protein